MLPNAVCHATHAALRLKPGGTRGSRSLRPWPAAGEDPAPRPARDPDPDPDPCAPESGSRLLVRPVRGFPVPPGSRRPGAGPARAVPGGAVPVVRVLPYFSYYWH